MDAPRAETMELPRQSKCADRSQMQVAHKQRTRKTLTSTHKETHLANEANFAAQRPEHGIAEPRAPGGAAGRPLTDDETALIR